MELRVSMASLPMKLLRLQKEGTELTETEVQVLRRIAMGDSQAEAARRLGKSLETVRKQTKVARARLRARTNAHAIAIAVSLDLI
jgi:DNA-binding CsgD family transcriptional regulator